MTAIPKAVLYYNPASVWASAVLLGLEEKGYGSDELELKVVDLKNGENFAPAFLRINPGGTVPALVVPLLESTLAIDVPNKYRALTDTKSVLEFLDRSRSATSKTHTTSSAPAPALGPAVMALSEVSNSIIDMLHSVPINFLSVGASTPEALIAHAQSPRGDYVKSRQAALQKYMTAEGQGAHENVQKLWATRHAENGFVVRVYEAASVPASELNTQQKQEREAFFKKSVEVWTGIKDILTRLENEIIGPYTLGDQLSLADMHLGAWFTRLLFVSGASTPPSSHTTPRAEDLPEPEYSGFKKLEDSIRSNTGNEGFLLGSKLCVFFDLFKDRECWRQTYANGLH